MNEDRSADQNSLPIFAISIYPALTIGLPFCAFKFIFGIIAARIGSTEAVGWLTHFGWAVMGWAAVDLLMNLARIAIHFIKGGPVSEFCLLALIGSYFSRARLFLAIDTFLSFFIICFFLWSGWITLLSRAESYCWYAATTVNLIGLSILNILAEYKNK